MTSNKDPFREKTLSKNLIHQGSSFDYYSDEVELPDGKTARRNYVKYPPAVVILPILDNGNILLIRQFRYAVGEVVLELPAGKVDPEETDYELAARRELHEETDYEASALHYLFSFYPAIGYSSEEIYAYIATGLKKSQGQPDEDEFIQTYEYSPTEIQEMLSQNQIKDSKTLLVLQYYFQNIKE